MTNKYKYLNLKFEEDEFRDLKADKQAIGGSWKQVVTEAIEALAERERDGE